MKRILISLLALLLVGCTSKGVEPTTTPSASPVAKIHVLAPKGATAMAILPLLDQEMIEVDLVDGSDIIQAALVSPDKKYDIIIAPTNLGAKLSSADKSTYKMSAVLTWGNLFIVGKDESSLINPEATIALFGDKAIPGIVYNLTKQDRVLSETYYGAVNEAQAQLLANQVDLALLAEPAVSATLAKNEELKILVDLQAEYKALTGLIGYPQASLFVEGSRYLENKDQMDEIINLIKNNLDTMQTSTEGLEAMIEKATPERLGVPSAKIMVNAYPRLNLKFVYAKEAKVELEAFLSELGIKDATTYIIE